MTTLEKIRAEVEHMSVWEQVSTNSAIIRGGDEVKDIVLKILDKYASEECENDYEHCAYIECPKEPCEDAISREAVLDAIKRISLGQTDAVKVSMMTEEYVKWLPSVQPKGKQGHWIELPKALNPNENPCKCSECGHILSFMNYYPKSDFCPNCGARMVSK